MELTDETITIRMAEAKHEPYLRYTQNDLEFIEKRKRFLVSPSAKIIDLSGFFLNKQRENGRLV